MPNRLIHVLPHVVDIAHGLWVAHSFGQRLGLLESRILGLDKQCDIGAKRIADLTTHLSPHQYPGGIDDFFLQIGQLLRGTRVLVPLLLLLLLTARWLFSL